MRNKKIILICFVLIALLQLWAPASMIWNRESVLKNGKAYKFRSAPVDPNDPFRGKYIDLNFEENSIVTRGKGNWERGQTIFVRLKTDARGFAKILSISKHAPSKDDDYIKAKVAYVGYDSLQEVNIEWPFERFYMEESKAAGVETAYNSSSRDTSQVAYALVKVKRGDAVLENVFINDKPIVSYLKK